MFGLEDAPLTGRRIVEFYADAGERVRFVENLRTRGVIRDREVVMRDGHGQPRAMIITASLIIFEGQEAVLATSNDITDRRHAEALFRSVVETSPDGIGIADLSGSITYVSPRLIQVFGCQQAEDMLGRDLRAFTSPDEHERIEERLMAILKNQSAGPSEWMGLRGDGSVFPLEISGEVLRDAGGAPRSFFFIVRDISVRKRMERAIRWGEKLESLGLMAAGIAHSLNNAFQVTQGHLELAQELCHGDVPMAGLLTGVGEGMDRAALLAREMLAYSGQTLKMETPLQIGRLVEEVLVLRRDMLPADLQLEFTATADLPVLHGDEDQIMKAISALILNATEAMAEQAGSIGITATMKELTQADLTAGFWPVPGWEGRYVQLEVRDAGTGIPNDQLERICDPFFSTKGQGRGLGLSVAMGILRTHSASLQIQSQPGLGTAVRAYFPVSTREALVAPPRGETRPIPFGVLIAEDDDSIRELVIQMLPKWGFGPIFAARNGAEALELFRNHQRDIGLFLTDSNMPKMSGPEAFDAMRRLQPTLRAILMTGYSEAFGRGTAASFGFSDFVQKPFSFAQLKARLLEARSEQTIPDC
jgi:PAS domain S-box-containing protein